MIPSNDLPAYSALPEPQLLFDAINGTHIRCSD